MPSSLSCILLATVAVISALPATKSPNIVFIVSDDLGFNDVSFHGSNQIGTPNIDAFFKSGLALMNYHVQPVCSPTRATFMSGRHAIHTGIYMPFSQATPLRLNLSFTLLPEYLKKCCGYETHMVGKWHLGQNVMKSIPIGRGFDTYLGYWCGAEDYYLHNIKGAYDLNDDVAGVGAAAKLRPAAEFNNTYSTPTFTARAVSIIEKYTPDSTAPFFLYLPYQNVHWPLEAPQEYVDMYANTTGGNHARNYVTAMAKIMDDGIGNVTAALKKQGLFEETLIIFSSDNGGPTNGNEGTMSNNFPMRGGKNTIWEGGTRVVGVIAGKGINVPTGGAITYEKHHATDWLPTLVSMAAGEDWKKYIAKDEPPYMLGDGIDNWEMLSSGGKKPSARDWILLETHPGSPEDRNLALEAAMVAENDHSLEAYKNNRSSGHWALTKAAGRVHGDAFILGDMKIIWWANTMPQDENGWFPPPGEDSSKVNYLLPCASSPGANGTFPRVGHAPSKTECHTKWCLFNVTADPCEYTDLADQMPDVVTKLATRLLDFSATAVPPITGEGCQPVMVPIPGSTQMAWAPCDHPNAMDTN